MNTTTIVVVVALRLGMVNSEWIECSNSQSGVNHKIAGSFNFSPESGTRFEVFGNQAKRKIDYTTEQRTEKERSKETKILSISRDWQYIQSSYASAYQLTNITDFLTLATNNECISIVTGTHWHWTCEK